MKVVVFFPLRELFKQVYIPSIRQKLIKLYVVGRMGTPHLSVERWTPRPIIDMADSQILYMPMKLGLKLMTVVCPNGMDPEGEF
jgi:hypothetical protein